VRKLNAWRGKQVLVTGAGGFIGSHLAEALHEQGASVRALVKYNSRGSWGWLDDASASVKDSIDVVLGDVQDAQLVRRTVEGCEVVFHLAALIGIPYSYRAASSYLDTNVRGTLNILQACLEEGVGRVVQTSTSEVYGTARYTPMDETHPLQAQSPYAASKIGADKLAESFHASFDLPVATVRPFNCFGPRQSSRAVIPTIIAQALRADRLTLGSLDPVRDFTFVTDTVDAFLFIAACDAAIGRVTNVGMGEGHAIGQVAEMVTDLVGRSLPIEQTSERKRPEKSEVMELVCDASRLHEMTPWRPRHDLREGLEITIQWIKEHLDDYRPSIYSI